MKTILSFLILSIAVLNFSGCTKTVDVITPTQTYSVTGNWYISDAAANDGNGWYSIDASLPGEFSFYENGVAQYADNLGSMQGYWNSTTVSDAYYDEYGNYETNVHDDFKINVSADDGSCIHLSFDDISFGGSNRFIATYYTGKSIERYTFSKY